MNLYNIIYIFHNKRRHEKKKKIERHENGLSTLKYT